MRDLLSGGHIFLCFGNLIFFSRNCDGPPGTTGHFSTLGGGSMTPPLALIIPGLLMSRGVKPAEPVATPGGGAAAFLPGRPPTDCPSHLVFVQRLGGLLQLYPTSVHQTPGAPASYLASFPPFMDLLLQNIYYNGYFISYQSD